PGGAGADSGGPRRWGRRLRPGPGTLLSRARMAGLDVSEVATDDELLEREIVTIRDALAEHGPLGRDELAARVRARYWGPGRFSSALRTAIARGAARRTGPRRYTAP